MAERDRLAELRPIAVSVLGEGGSRAINFLFYLAVARALSPEGFGEVRYTIALATLAIALVQVAANAASRELGAMRQDSRRTGELVGTALLVGLALYALSVALCLGASAAGLTGSATPVGLVAAVSGLAVFQLYYQAARGVGGATRAALVYLATAVLNVTAFVLLWVAIDVTPTVALLVFGTSSVLPIVVAELASPLVFRTVLPPTWVAGRALWTVGGPLVVAQVGYLAWTTADQIWVETQLGTHEIGLYSAARNLAILLVIIPAGIAGVLAPRIAELLSSGREARARALLRRLVPATAAVTGAIALALVAVREPLLEFFYGDDYAPAGAALVGLSASAVSYSAFAVLANGAVGWGRARVYALGVGVAAVAEVVFLTLSTSTSATTAAWASAASITLGLVVSAGWLRIRPLRLNGRG
jgi:O-antigen/teichoic acid export membrane protein